MSDPPSPSDRQSDPPSGLVSESQPQQSTGTGSNQHPFMVYHHRQPFEAFQPQQPSSGTQVQHHFGQFHAQQTALVSSRERTSMASGSQQPPIVSLSQQFPMTRPPPAPLEVVRMQHPSMAPQLQPTSMALQPQYPSMSYQPQLNSSHMVDRQLPITPEMIAWPRHNPQHMSHMWLSEYMAQEQNERAAMTARVRSLQAEIKRTEDELAHLKSYGPELTDPQLLKTIQDEQRELSRVRARQPLNENTGRAVRGRALIAESERRLAELKNARDPRVVARDIEIDALFQKLQRLRSELASM